jgi:hypothetical protein
MSTYRGLWGKEQGEGGSIDQKSSEAPKVRNHPSHRLCGHVASDLSLR